MLLGSGVLAAKPEVARAGESVPHLVLCAHLGALRPVLRGPVPRLVLSSFESLILRF